MKVGIITHYYTSINYGGNLQAYALCSFLKKNGVEVEQIQYRRANEHFGNRVNKKASFIQRVYNKGVAECARTITKRIFMLFLKKEYNSVIERRRHAFREFNQEIIPHSNVVYDIHSIANSENEYDLFITGSDQVWNFQWYESAYFLDFVKKKPKFSYAASFAMNELDSKQQTYVKKALCDYQDISIRESEALNLLKGLTNIEPKVVVDPTLLLDEEEWDEVCAKRLIKENYIFSYFLGENEKARKVAEKFAKQRKLSLVSIVYASGDFKIENSKYGDFQLIDVGPERFLSLVKYAAYVFTDSFHAVAFSFIYHKQFFVFNRDKNGTMSSRIISLTNMLDLQDRFCSNKEMETIEYVKNIKDIDYSQRFPKYENYRIESEGFIKKNIV